MRVTTHENTNLTDLKTETPDDHFILGRLAQRLGIQAPCHNGQRQMQVDTIKLIKLAAGVALLLLCSFSTSAQVPFRTETAQAQSGGQISKPIVLPKPKRLRFDWGDGVYWAGSFADIASSIGQHESNPALKNAQGNFSLGKGLALKSGVYAAIKLLEWKYPQNRRTTLWFKVGIGVAYGCIALHNAQVRRR